MQYDISVMTTGNNGVVDYRFPSMRAKIVGREKLVQHYIKALYDDNVGKLLKSMRENKEWSEMDVRRAVLMADSYIKDVQKNKNLHPEEALRRVTVKALRINKQIGELHLEVSLHTVAGDINITL